MTRRSSLRAQTQEIYRDLTSQKTTVAAAGAPSPGADEPCPLAQNLTEKVRALYEHSAVPVAEIAQLAGVTERTIYKYVQKGRWKPRYAWIDRGGIKRRRGWRANDGFVPGKGAGGRFIARADKGKRIAVGLKATDPEGALRAVANCSEAAHLAGAALAEAQAAQRAEALNRAIEWNAGALKDLREFHQRRDKARPGPFDGRQEDILFRIANMALARWEALLAKEEAARLAG
jgi:predicted transcriptional regulator